MTKPTPSQPNVVIFVVGLAAGMMATGIAQAQVLAAPTQAAASAPQPLASTAQPTELRGLLKSQKLLPASVAGTEPVHPMTPGQRQALREQIRSAAKAPTDAADPTRTAQRPESRP